MGNGGSLTGDPSPRSRTVVQRTAVAAGSGCNVERDWRCVTYVLSCEIITFKATLLNQQANLNWSVLCRQEADHFILERSIDGLNFSDVKWVTGRSLINEVENYVAIDDVSAITNKTIYYRLKTVLKNGRENASNILTVKNGNQSLNTVQVFPNPVIDKLLLNITADKTSVAKIYIIDASGRTVKVYSERIQSGNNTISWSDLSVLQTGDYYLKVFIETEVLSTKFNVIK